MQTITIEQTDSQCVVTWKHYSWDIFILFPFFFIWTGACVFMTYMVFIPHQLWALLFTLPFWGFWYLMFSSIVDAFFGKTRLVLDTDGFNSIWTCLFLKREKQFKLADIQRFEIKTYDRKGRTYYLLRIVLQQRTAKIRIPENGEELIKLCEQFNRFLLTLKPEARVPEKWEMPDPIVFALDSPLQHVEPPSKSRWSYQMGYNSVGFHKWGEGKISEAIVLLTAAILWNGFIAFVALGFLTVPNPENQLEGGLWWFVVTLLIIFGSAGLFIAGCAINMFLNLFFRRTSWQFSCGEAICRTARLGPARIKHYNLTGWNSLAIRVVRAKKNEPKDNTELRKFYEEGDHWQVAFLDKNENDLAVIENLHKPEALWMADVILREQRAIR